MACIICGQGTGDGCVPLCEEHMGIASVAGRVGHGFVTDWPDCAHVATHDELMTADIEPSDRTSWQTFLWSIGVG